MKTNTSLSAFTGGVTETKGVISAELTIGSKTLTTAFFVVDVGGRYNLYLGGIGFMRMGVSCPRSTNA
jgi:hypothetical protein